MQINIVEHADGTESVFVRGNLMESPPETAEYRACNGVTTQVRIQSFKLELVVEDKVAKKESNHEQPGS